MSKLLEGTRRIYSGNGIIIKHLLFMLLGLMVVLATQNPYFLILYLPLVFYMSGYGYKFINNVFNNETVILPEINKEPIFIMQAKFPIIMFLLAMLFEIPERIGLSEYLLALIGVVAVLYAYIATILGIGYAKNFDVKDILNVFNVFKFKDYTVTIFKLIWILLLIIISVIFLIEVITPTVAFMIFPELMDLNYGSTAHDKWGILAIIAPQWQGMVSVALDTILVYFLFVAGFVWTYDFSKIYQSKIEKVD